MKRFRLTLITENQNSIEKANKFASLVCEVLNSENGFKISKYNKLKNAYKIEIMGRILDQKNLIAESIELTDRICSPWIVTFNRTENNVDLMFNKSDYSSFKKNEFNVLCWAEFVIENE